ncbi:MAG: hypothetical protein V3S55_06240 [Nitrospiraceae bacterium]
MKLIRFVLVLVLLASPLAAQKPENPFAALPAKVNPKVNPFDDLPDINARFIIIRKATGLDWALLLDTRTGKTWRLGALQKPNPDIAGSFETQWFWVPIKVCAECR